MSDQFASVEQHRNLALRALKISQRWVLPIFLTAVGACMSSAQSGQKVTNQSSAPQFETDPAKGRDFRELSVHPNSEELLFVECSRALEPTGGCYVLRYSLTTKNLQRYALPAGYFYETASFSPRGNYVLMSRVPKTDGNEENQEKVRQTYENAEIVLMKAADTDFKVLPLAKGNKVAPVMSRDETQVAYWRATLRPPGSKTFSSNFDVWEVNLNTGQDNLFAGPFSFFERTNLQYLSQDEMLVGAYGPREYALSMSAYDKKNNHSQVYRIKRGTATLSSPVLTEIEYAGYPSSDIDGNFYFFGQRPGVSLFRKDVQGQIKQWVLPETLALGGLRYLVTAPNGSYMVFAYVIRGTHPRDAKKGIGLLNLRTSEWSRVSIPSLQSSTSIAVKAAN